MRRLQLPATASLASVAVLLAVGCGSSAGGSDDPRGLLRQAKGVLDAAPALHVALTSANLPPSGASLSAADGDVLRPDKFEGTLTLAVSGSSIEVKVVSAAGAVYAQLPFSNGLQKIDPQQYGVGDPAKLIDPKGGISGLLITPLSATKRTGDRLKGELLDEVAVTLDGAQVAAVLTSADPSRPVTGTLGVSAKSHELRRVVLTGPFFDPSVLTTFTLILTNYGEKLSITAPAG
ncbi:MAG: LppX_LprAFG lipoprotein [Actinomycetota bacterium]|nr:LppX_LprAFG lipoprotein [Actinomycetota bacterium]